MQRYVSIFIVGCALALVAIASPLRPWESKTPAYRAVHLLNLPSPEAEAKSLGILGEFNQMLAQLGYPNVQYRLWKVHGEQGGNYSYLWDSIWPDRATYDKVHEHEAWRKLYERHRQAFEEIFENQIYNRYEEVLAGDAKKK